VTAPTVTDAFVTPVPWPRGGEPPYVRDLMSSLFGRDHDEVWRRRSPVQLVEEMDAAGVWRAVLNAVPGTIDEVRAFVRAFPERFLLSAEFDPRRGMETVATVRRMIVEDGLALVRLVPFEFELPPDHAVFFPIYAACAELGVPVSMTMGMPGPPMPADVGRPLNLDLVCRHFPELRVVMAHGADPWWDEAIRMMVKFANLSMMISDCSPRHLPPSLIHYMNTRGRSKVLFATGYPVLTFERSLAEVDRLDLRPGVAEDFLHGNADRLFGGGKTTTPEDQ
jgi:predicted TIM-barrel fold metal-dependent hydrolase